MLNFANGILTKVATLTLLMFSGIQGNNPAFINLSIISKPHGVIISSYLTNAFDNDFKDIFKSGKKIDIWFEIRITDESNNLLYLDKFNKIVVYNPLKRIYQLTNSYDGKTEYINNYSTLLEQLSNITYYAKINLKEKTSYRLTLKSTLKKITLTNSKKEVDLKMLWNYKTPKIEKIFIGKEYEV